MNVMNINFLYKKNNINIYIYIKIQYKKVLNVLANHKNQLMELIK